MTTIYAYYNLSGPCRYRTIYQSDGPNENTMDVSDFIASIKGPIGLPITHYLLSYGWRRINKHGYYRGMSVNDVINDMENDYVYCFPEPDEAILIIKIEQTEFTVEAWKKQ